MAPYEALYGRRCRTPIHRHLVGKRKYLVSKLVDQATKVIQKIQQRMKTSLSWQKIYTDRRHQPLEFEVGNQDFARTSPMRGALRFWKEKKAKSMILRTFRHPRTSWKSGISARTATLHDWHSRSLSCIDAKEVRQ